MTYQSRNSIRVTQARNHQPHPELEVSQVTFSVGGQSPRDDRDKVSCLRPVVDEDGRRHITLSFSCTDEDRPNVILGSCNSLGVDVHQQNTSSLGLVHHATASRSPEHHLALSTGRSRVDFIDKSDAVDLPFVSTSQEIQNPPFGDNKLSRVNNTGKPCEHLTTEQTHSGRGVAEYCVLQTRHDQDVHRNESSSHAKASASRRLHSGVNVGHNNTQPVHRRSANLSPQFKTRTIIKPFPVYGSTGTEIKHHSCTPPTNRDNVNRVGFSSPSRNVETKCWVASGQSKDNNSQSEYTFSSSPIQVSIGGLGLRECEESEFENSRENITGCKKTSLESKQLRVPTVLTITPSSSHVREFGDQIKSLTFVKELDKSTNSFSNVGITELRISSSCASPSLGDRSSNNMDSTNNNPRDESNLVNCMDDPEQNQDNHGLQASRIFKPIKHDVSGGRYADSDTRLSAPERPVCSSSSAPTTPSFPKPFVPHGCDVVRQQYSQHETNYSPQGMGSRAEEVSSMARSTYRNSNSKAGQQTEVSGTRLGFGSITTVASLKPLGVTKLAKVSKKSLQSFEDFTPTSSPTASRRSSVSSQDLSDATNEVKVLLARDVSIGDTAGHNVRVSAVQLPRKSATLNLRQSSLETDTRVSPMENSKKLFIGGETGEMKNVVGIRTDFSEFRLHGTRVSPRNSPKSFIRTHTISAPSSPVRSLQDLTIKMKETPSASPLLSPRDNRPFSPMSEPAEDQGCVPDIQDEFEHPGCSKTLPRNFHRRRPKTAPSVPTALLREVSNVGKELKDRVSTSTHRDASSPLKFSFQPINVKIKEDTESDSDRTILSHVKSNTISVKKRKKPTYSGQSTDSSESNGESNGRSRSDPTQDRKRSGETGEAVFENLQESQKGHSSSSIVSAESALSISSMNTTLSDPNGEETFTDAYEEVLREPDGPICDSLDQAKHVGKSQFKQKSLTWPNGEKSENELAEYCADKINMASSAPEVSGIEGKSPVDSTSQHPRNRSPVLMPKQKSLTDSPKRADSFSDSSLDSVRHKRSTSEPAPVDLSKSRADSSSDRQLPTLTVTTSQELGPTQRRFERKKPIIGSVPASQFLQPEPLEDQPSTTGSTPDLSQNSKNSRLESLMTSRSSATLPRAAAPSKVEELSPKTKQKRKKENLKQHVMTTLLETEKSYVQCLESLIKRYQRPLKSAEFTGICDAGIVDSMFYKIPEILQNHENFLQQLEMGIENKHTVQKIANLITNSFSKQPVLDAYTAFTNNFDHAKELIGKASQKLGFIRFLEERTKEHKERFHIDDLIIQPVQRIPRYELLLKDLIDNTPTDHEDLESLNMALDTVRKLATAVDESKNQADNARKDEQALRELEGLIDGVDLVSPHRKFVRQYAITEMKGGKKERCLFLFSDMIICASVKRRSGGLRRPSVTVLLPIEASKYKLAWKVHIEDVEILKSTPNAKRANQERDLSRLEEDLTILNRVSGLSDTLNCSHVVLDDALKELIDSVSKKISEHQALTSLPISPLNKVELSVTSPEGIDTFIIFFHNTESRVSFENEVADAKKKLAASSRNHFPPVFLDAIPIMKTRSGMQFSCASPSLGTINDSLREVWVCNSDGYVGQVCLLNLNPEPTVAFCISLCSARILCIAAVPGTQEHPNGRGKLRITNTSFQSLKPSPPVKPASFRPVSMGNSTEASEIMAFDSDDSEDEEMKLPDEMANNVELNVLAVEESAKDSDGEYFDDRDTHLEESQSDFEIYQPTMWLGTEDCCIHVYQCTDNLRTKKSRAKIRHPAAVHCILYLDNKVFVALANGDLTVYKRELGQGWDTTNPMTVTLGSSTTPITRMVAVRGKLWCGCQNNILVVDPNNLNIQHQFAVCNDNQRAVYCMVSSGWGVWVSLQSSAVVRLFHATTYESLCNVDVTQTVQKMLAGSDAIIRQHKAACLRITALLVCRDLLWMGTSAGVVLTLPMPKLGLSSTTLKESPTVTGSNQGHTGHVRFLTFVDLNNAFSNNNNASKRITLPNMGERTNDTLIEGAVTNHEERRKSGSSDMLVISGGDGYEDFGATTPNELAGKEDSTNHLLLWQV